MAMQNSGVRRLAVANGPNIFQMLLVRKSFNNDKCLKQTGQQGTGYSAPSWMKYIDKTAQKLYNILIKPK